MKIIKIPKWKGTTTTILTRAQETGNLILVNNDSTRKYLYQLAEVNNISPVRIITAKDLVNIWGKTVDKNGSECLLVHEYDKVFEEIIKLISEFKIDLSTIIEE